MYTVVLSSCNCVPSSYCSSTDAHGLQMQSAGEPPRGWVGSSAVRMGGGLHVCLSAWSMAVGWRSTLWVMTSGVWSETTKRDAATCYTLSIARQCTAQYSSVQHITGCTLTSYFRLPDAGKGHLKLYMVASKLGGCFRHSLGTGVDSFAGVVLGLWGLAQECSLHRHVM